MFKNPFSFEGRIRRTEYGLSILIFAIPAFAINIIGQSQPIIFICLLPLLWFVWAQSAKRCHDRNNSGWFQLIPFYGLWLLFGDGDSGDNDYGPDPKMRDRGSVVGGMEIIDSNVKI